MEVWSHGPQASLKRGFHPLKVWGDERGVRANEGANDYVLMTPQGNHEAIEKCFNTFSDFARTQEELSSPAVMFIVFMDTIGPLLEIQDAAEAERPR
jgi:hypothetical protein